MVVKQGHVKVLAESSRGLNYQSNSGVGRPSNLIGYVSGNTPMNLMRETTS